VNRLAARAREDKETGLGPNRLKKRRVRGGRRESCKKEKKHIDVREIEGGCQTRIRRLRDIVP